MFPRLVAAALALPSFTAFASDDDNSGAFGTRYELGVEKKLFSKNLRVSVSDELRLAEDFSFDRNYLNFGVSYKFLPWLKAGLAYSSIAVAKDKEFDGGVVVDYTDWRHRAAVDLTESVSWGGFKFSLKEKYQVTYKTRSWLNTWEQPRFSQAIRVKAKLSYPFKRVWGLRSLEPYAAGELRLLLNGVKYSSDAVDAIFTTSDERRIQANVDDYDNGFKGFNNAYLNRVRGEVGLSFEFDKRNSLDLFVLMDSLTDRDYQAYSSDEEYTKNNNYIWNHRAGQLKSYDVVRSKSVSIGLSYIFKF